MEFNIEDFDESLLGAVGYSNNFKGKQSLPIKASSPSSLIKNLLDELNFPEGPSLLSSMEKWNEDLFSCIPRFLEIYIENSILSTSVDEVIKNLDNSLNYDDVIDFQVHGPETFPKTPLLEEELENYVTSVQKYFLSELKAREVTYSFLLTKYCKALLLYLRYNTKSSIKGNKDINAFHQKFKQNVRERYYREVANIARLLYLHLYLSVTREVSWKLHADQVLLQSVFVSLSYSWSHRRQFECIFHPILFNHGIVNLENNPLTFKELQKINYRRHILGLPLIRAGLVEEDNQPLMIPPEFSSKLPRTIGFLTQQIRAKMEAYSDNHPVTPKFPRIEHSYAKPIDPINYGTTIEAMMDPPSPSAILPGDPNPEINVKVKSTVSSFQIPPNITLEELESGEYNLFTDGVTYNDIPENELNKMFQL
ncbi:transactivating tegument protein VP16 [Canid alphaherpesvirus 1]|uniref:Tegument protein VP16 homolog n=1 Tax=Canid alphaherpesvirus 1 TaxID=170325 RepID=Q8B635_9ALPH|nr:transactivating tegument protein VP16 [Canid alphaherpesvirus 1]AAN85477.1 alpha-TIF [Canid alphaherpesvirus 1]ALL25888.1 transactivating tegument protein VP16 [Canid alphaherpesvirus 1]ALL25968.1 transactivating tegument protein VP16 [Canid alphaherpesvirus 1]ALL26044.1 transactivating tegument protein VP16 [Canid alphaherpesvirus 1]ARE29816.1 transactivating tegument protein VP16 [Canid alphaherpesvirus 1]